ncbi:MAG TPA: polyhydroxyalkanoate synthesis regulator DNA-binding domain-containing protein [Anaerolineae bacterium]|nr:polyhydroxyalkanoate synthesis regulator DNA-binding domain-containing protein [Anaerolineae bacterium]
MIKRYPNRKLYDTQAKQYITLEGIAALIREGGEVQVVDHATGEDVTSATLTQVILGSERKRSGFLPLTLLAGWIRAGGDTLNGLHHSLAPSLELAHQVDEEIERRVQVLVKGGEMAATEAARLRALLLSLGTRALLPSLPDDEKIEQSLVAYGIPTREELGRLSDKLDRLEEMLEGLTREATQ